MGALYLHECKACGYTEEVSGGSDCGIKDCTITIVCLDCQKLHDFELGPHTSQSLEPTEPKPIRCRKGKKHRVQEWRSGDACPKCGNPLDRGDLTCIWD